ncbi:LysR substrate-binding domain-containing protein [Malikia sp.]|uniref:LysR substrate-binding domain-containing protein n=1 Tax=Malikia sp. TaxID=2070706 RepID=UPI0026028C0A|nr:LysR substrate-binding domain-containing protein [Malikia sp.]MDD2730476.1 LysR substrate-binding domain-containing protein [Malikia sp.]
MRRKLPSTQALICFVAAARHQSFTRAAQELFLTQGAVSRQVAALEESLGIELFRRTQHGMTLTPAGADYARQVAQRLDALERDTLDLMGRRGQGESVTLAVVPTLAARWLIPRLATLAREQPELTVNIDGQTRPFLFGDTGVDAAIFAGTGDQVRQWAGTRAQRLFEEVVVPVCSPTLLRGRSGLTPAALADLPLLQQSTRPDAWRQWFESQGVDAPSAMAGPRYEQYSMQVAAAASGLGVALMPKLLIEAELASGQLLIASPHPVLSRRSYYLVQPDLPERPALERFKSWLLACAARQQDQPLDIRRPLANAAAS